MTLRKDSNACVPSFSGTSIRKCSKDSGCRPVKDLHCRISEDCGRGSATGFEASAAFEEHHKTPYIRCFDVERLQAQYQVIRERVWQCHATKAYEILELADQPKKEQQKKRGEAKEVEIEDYELESEVFEVSGSSSQIWSNLWKPKSKTRAESGKSKRDSSIAARKLGLTKAEEFTGSEAKALRKLLKTLRVKTWGPELYFHIRFFSSRNTMKPMTSEAKALVGYVLLLMQL